jgi:hypothetical protein
MKLLLLFVIVGAALLMSHFGKPAQEKQIEETASSGP